jgi:hypothetical protein
MRLVLDGLDQEALVRVTWQDRRTGLTTLAPPPFGVEQESPFGFGSRMAFVAVFDQDGTDFGFKPVVGLLGLHGLRVDRSDHGSQEQDGSAVGKKQRKTPSIAISSRGFIGHRGFRVFECIEQASELDLDIVPLSTTLFSSRAREFRGKK